MFGLVDCNNFYCSCERVFNPALRTSPVVVLSNNDGCVIARSNEAKALGIEMGAPFYKVKAFLERNKVAVFSSNYTLYGDMSRRVMMLLAGFTPALTQYSIDEAFIDLSGFDEGEALRSYGRQIVSTADEDLGEGRRKVRQALQGLRRGVPYRHGGQARKSVEGSDRGRRVGHRPQDCRKT